MFPIRWRLFGGGFRGRDEPLCCRGQDGPPRGLEGGGQHGPPRGLEGGGQDGPPRGLEGGGQDEHPRGLEGGGLGGTYRDFGFIRINLI